MISLSALVDVLDRNWESEAALREVFLCVPKFGNDNTEADEMVAGLYRQVNHLFMDQAKLYGRRWGIDVIGWTGAVIWGQRTAATPDGRLRGSSLCDSIGASQGRDRNGVTAALLSAAKLPHSACHSILALNLRFGDDVFGGPEAPDQMLQLVNSGMALGLQQMQINVVSAATLRQAQHEPEAFSSLMVRIGGFSTYFNWLSREHQDDIIARTEYGL
ncbi:MAG: hypothetical protein GXY52_09820 [Chloroflexi bacterium]|nr:hypothetical protein [Chloroflexota bacterium]